MDIRASLSTVLRYGVAVLVAATVSFIIPMPTVADARDVPVDSTTGFTPLQPTRVMDTRRGLGGDAVAAGESRLLDLSSLPSAARSVSLNVTAVGPTDDTFVTVWPAGGDRPDTSNLNLRAGEIRANAALVGVGRDASVSLFNAFGSTHLIVDVLGWSSEAFTGIEPSRIVDTRKGLGGGRVASDGVLSARVAGVAGVPADAAAIALNVTAVEPTGDGFLTVWPTGVGRPDTSNVNFAAGTVVPNLVVVGVGADGSISVYNHGGFTHVLVDVTGWFSADGGFEPLASPERMLDTRKGTCGFRLSAGEVRNVRVTDRTDVGAVALNVTAVGATATSFITVWPAGSPRPDASTLNVVAGGPATPNFVSVGVGPAGEVSLFNAAGAVDLIVDVFGVFAGVTPGGVASPCGSTSRSSTSIGDLILAPELHLALSEDRAAVWVCRIPADTTVPFYSHFGSERAALTPESVAAAAQSMSDRYFPVVSRGRYTVTFTALGYIDLAADEGPHQCLDRAEDATSSPFTNVIAVDQTNHTGGFAGPGLSSVDWDGTARWRATGDTPGVFVASPSETSRGVWVGGGVFTRPCPHVLIHEIGHTLHWPHSHISVDDDYDNPLDVMSAPATRYDCDPHQTIAVNRLASGWIDDTSVAVHGAGRTTVDLAPPQGGGVELLVAPAAADPHVMLTLEARPKAGLDAGLERGGVAVHVVDQRRRQDCFRVCYGLRRYQGQAFGRPNSYDHVLSVGQTRTVDGVTITVQGRSPSGGFLVTVDGQYIAPPIRTGH